MAIVNTTKVVQSYNNPNISSNQIMVDYHELDFEEFETKGELFDPIHIRPRNRRAVRISPAIDIHGNNNGITLDRWGRDDGSILPSAGQFMDNVKDSFKDFWGGVKDEIKKFGEDILRTVMEGIFNPQWRKAGEDPLEKLWEQYVLAGMRNPMLPISLAFLYKDEALDKNDRFGLWPTDKSKWEDFYNTVKFLQNAQRHFNSYRMMGTNHMRGEGASETASNLPHPNRPNRSSKTVTQLIHAIGPDFMQHKFDAFFVWDFEGGNPFDFNGMLDNMGNDDSWLTDYEKYILSRNGFAVRFGTITIPPVTNEEFKVPFLQTEILKVKSTKKMENKATFSLRLDQHLFWLDKINELANRKNGIDETFPLHQKSHPYFKGKEKTSSNANADKLYSWRVILKTLAKSWPKEGAGSYPLKSAKLSLIVKMIHLSNWVNPNYQHPALPYFVFDDIRILGTTDAIQYDRKSADLQSINVNFIFKRQYQINHGFLRSDADAETNWGLTNNSTQRLANNFMNRNGDMIIPQIPIQAPMFDWHNVSVHASALSSGVPAK